MPSRICTLKFRKAIANENARWDDWVSQERLRKLTDENRELAQNLKKDMDAQRRAAAGKPPLIQTGKRRPFGSDLTGSSVGRGSEERSSVAPQPPRGTKRAREIEGIDKVRLLCLLYSLNHHRSRLERSQRYHQRLGKQILTSPAGR